MLVTNTPNWLFSCYLCRAITSNINCVSYDVVPEPPKNKRNLERILELHTRMRNC